MSLFVLDEKIDTNLFPVRSFLKHRFSYHKLLYPKLQILRAHFKVRPVSAKWVIFNSFLLAKCF